MEAAVQVFYSLGPVCGGVIAMTVLYIVGMYGSSGTSVLFSRPTCGGVITMTVLYIVGMAGSSGTSILFSRTYLG